MHKIYSVTLMTYKQKTREFAYIALNIAALIVVYLCFPGVTSIPIFCIEPDIITQGGNYTWIPMTTTIGLSLLLPAFSYFYLKYEVQQDNFLGISQTILTTKTSKFQYYLGKYFANCILLWQIVLVVYIASFIMAKVFYPGVAIDFYTFTSPFLALASGVFLSAAVPIIFALTPVLNGFYGHIIFAAYYISSWWMCIRRAAIKGDMVGEVLNNVTITQQIEDMLINLWRFIDPAGAFTIARQFSTEVLIQANTILTNFKVLPMMMGEEGGIPIYFDGIDFTMIDFGFILCSILGVLTILYIYSKVNVINFTHKFTKSIEVKEEAYKFTNTKLNLNPLQYNFSFWNQVIMEIKLSFLQLATGWKLILVYGMSMLYTFEYERMLLAFPVFIIFIFRVISNSACRDYIYNTHSIASVSSVSTPILLGAKWIANFIILNVYLSGALIRITLAGDMTIIYSYIVGIIFLVSFALFLGIYTHSSKLFDALTVLSVYLTTGGIVGFFTYITLDPALVSVRRSTGYIFLTMVLVVLTVCKDRICRKLKMLVRV
ncbi:MAG: hypothetical protein ATN33_07190 [Epulopiscium sp. Nele67-Bin001]|nr:MAG: hypothetical protein ATN33_07190 [Epulopiscium sp. Nele67-Bin001]